MQLFGRIIVSLVAVFCVVAHFGGHDSHASAPAAQETPVTFRGTANGRDTSHSVDLHQGLVVVHARHAGAQNFQLTLALPEPGQDVFRRRDEAISIFNEVGRYDGGSAGRVRKGGSYVLALYASGSYEITIEQPPLAEVAEPGQTEFSGSGHTVTPVLQIPAGTHRISFTHDGQASFGPRGLAQVWLLDMDGNEVGGRLINEFGPFAGTVDLPIILEGPHIFHIDATGNWSIRLE